MLLEELENKINLKNTNDVTILKYLKNNCVDYYELTASKIATNCYVSNSYVTKFVKKYGYQDFNNFKMKLIEQNNKSRNDILRIEDFEINDYANEVLTTLINTTRVIDTKTITDAVNLINCSDQILLFGIGGSGVVCQDFYIKLLKLNKNVIYETDESLRYSICRNSKNDTLGIVFTYSGPNYETNKCIDTLKENNSKIIMVTKSTTDYNIDLKIQIDANEEAKRQYTIFSRIGMNFISDLLYLYLLKK